MINTLLHLRIRDLVVYFLYNRVVYFGGSEAPILYMTLMYYDVTFFGLNEKNIYDDRLFILFTCVKCVCEILMVCETNSNLVHSYHMNQQVD